MAYSKSVTSEKRIEDIENRLNNAEQYTRSWCVRIKGLSVPKDLVERVGLPSACMQHSYATIFFPVLKHAVDDCVIGPLYGFNDVLENGHFVSSGDKTRDGKSLPPTIIIRFNKRLHRNTFLQYKRQYMPNPNVVDAGAGVNYYSVTPDLTKINRSILHYLRQDARVQSAWSRDHRLFFSLKINPKVKHFISSIHHSTSELIQRAMSTLQNAPPPHPQNHRIQPPQHYNNRGQQLPRHRQQPRNQQQPLQSYMTQKPFLHVQQPQSPPAPHPQPAKHQTPDHHNRPTAQKLQQQPFTPALTRSHSQRADKIISPSTFKAGARRPNSRPRVRRPTTATTATAGQQQICETNKLQGTNNRFALLGEVSDNDF